MHPSFEQFVAALRDPEQRAGIGLSISEEDASTLLTRADWATDYYSRWIALFPAAAAEPEPEPAPPAPPAVAPEPAVVPAAAVPAAVVPAAFVPAAEAPAATPTTSPFGPPPGAAPTASGYGAVDTQSWAPPPRRKLSAARIAVITVLSLVALSVLAGVLNEVLVVTRTSATTPGKTPAAAAPSPSASTDGKADPVVFHGLTQTEYDFLEAALAPQGHTLEQVVAQGADDAALHEIAVNAESSMGKTCRDGEALDNGFDNAAFRASFLAGYESAQKATPEQATKVYDTLAAYCAAH